MNQGKHVTHTPSPRNIEKVENSIHKIQHMLQHMDGILAKYNAFNRNPELNKIVHEVEEQQAMHEHSARESDLVTLLNCEDFSDSGN